MDVGTNGLSVVLFVCLDSNIRKPPPQKKGLGPFPSLSSLRCHQKVSFLFLLDLCTLQGGFGDLEVACWPSVPKFAGSNPTEAVGFFRAKKILSRPSFGGEVKPSVQCRRFTACKRSLNVTWKSGIFRQNSLAISRLCSSTFGC